MPQPPRRAGELWDRFRLFHEGPHWSERPSEPGRPSFREYSHERRLSTQAREALARARSFDGRVFAFGHRQRMDFELATRAIPDGVEVRCHKAHFRMEGGRLVLLNEDVLTPTQRGNAFNAQQWHRYPHNEVFVRKRAGWGRGFLDSFDGKHVIERKFRQYAEMPNGQRQLLKDIDEAANYATGEWEVGDTRKNRLKLAGRHDLIGGDLSKKRAVLEIPRQHQALSVDVLKIARRKRVIVRDVNGHVYTPQSPLSPEMAVQET